LVTPVLDVHRRVEVGITQSLSC
jgi:hypothetical protein